jgi:hypothetical protein
MDPTSECAAVLVVIWDVTRGAPAICGRCLRFQTGLWRPAAQIRGQGASVRDALRLQAASSKQLQRRNFLLFGAQAGWHAALGSAGRSDSPSHGASVITDKSSTPASSPHQVPPASWLRAAAITRPSVHGRSNFDVFQLSGRGRAAS